MHKPRPPKKSATTCKTDFLKPGNYNTRHCKSCIFHPDPNRQFELRTYRCDEITKKLAQLKVSHICHVSLKTCYGAMELQAKVLYAQGILKEPTPECMVATAQACLGA